MSKFKSLFKMDKMSLKLKITLWYTLCLGLLSCGILLLVTNISTDVLLRDTGRELVMAVDGFERVITTNYVKQMPIPDRMLYMDGTQIAVYDNEGNLVVGRNPFGIEDVSFESTKTPREIKYNGDTYYIYDKPIFIGYGFTVWIRGAISVSEKTSAIGYVTGQNTIMILMVVILSGIGGYALLNRTFKPVDKIRATAQDIFEGSDLSKRIDIEDGHDELHTLATTFNQMLTGIESAFEKEKQFTSDASHELRTPISVILSQCEYGEECVTDMDEMKEIIGSIKGQTNKMAKLVSELLLISRMDNNKINLNMEETDLSELLTFVCEEQREIRGHDILLHQDIEPNVMANVDKLLMTRLFINLIANAYQYNKEAGEIVVSLRNKDNKVIFSVRDNGLGIAEEDLPKIWDRFYQVNHARNNNNSGLGLPMVKWIADCHKGELSVNSKLGEGSTFTLTLHK